MTNPDSAEQQKQILEDNPYGETIRNLIDDAPNFNANQLSHFIGSSLVEEIVASAEKGELYTQRENDATKELETFVYSVEDIISHQIEVALELQDAQPDNPNAWKVNIPRANGLRDAIMTVMQDKRLSEPFRLAIYRKQAEIMKDKDEAEQAIHTTIPEVVDVHAEELRHRAEEDLGEEAVEAADVRLEAAAASRIVSLDQQEAQKDPYDYLRTALPPVVRGEVQQAAEENKYDYDYLFNNKDQAAQPNARGFGQYEPAKVETAEEKQRSYYDRFVTEENRQASLDTLSEVVKATPEIREILTRHNLSPTEMSAVDAIRENSDVRFEVAKALVQKLDRLVSNPTNDMGDRINRNDSKNLKVDSVTGVRMSSRLYAVNMALKMIDGEFSSKHEGSDPIERKEDGSVIRGQHRHAATSTLMSYF